MMLLGLGIAAVGVAGLAVTFVLMRRSVRRLDELKEDLR